MLSWTETIKNREIRNIFFVSDINNDKLEIWLDMLTNMHAHPTYILFFFNAVS
jgi:hypothetical protein